MNNLTEKAIDEDIKQAKIERLMWQVIAITLGILLAFYSFNMKTMIMDYVNAFTTNKCVEFMFMNRSLSEEQIINWTVNP